MMPLAGFATGKVSARTLAVCGFTLFVLTFRYAANVTTLQMSFSQASWLRVIQMLPLPFCFISITNAAYVGMPKEESNQVAGLINFARNMGGSILIAVTNAQVTSRAMWHQQHLQANMGPGSIGYELHLQALKGYFSGHFGSPNSMDLALASIYNQLNPQAQLQALPGRLHATVVDVVRPHRARLHAQQEQAGRGRRWRRDALRRKSAGKTKTPETF